MYQIRSDIRYAIVDAFTKAGIVIAFPQRDIHIDASQPLQLQLVDGTQKIPSAISSEKPLDRH